MNVAEIREMVSRISYKPGWRFILHCESPAPWDGLWVDIEALLPNSRPGGLENVLVRGRATLPLYASDRRLIMEAVRHGIRVIEDHETSEWLALDGFLWEDPHGSTTPVKVRQ